MKKELEKLIERLEIELLQPDVRRFGKRMMELLADDFLEFGMFGKMFNKQEMIKHITGSTSEPNEKYEAMDFEATKIAAKTIRLTYKASIENINTGEKFWTLRCSIWQKRGNAWQIIFHQGTIIK